MQQGAKPVIIAGETRYLNQNRINQLASDLVLVKSERGSLDELYSILKTAFPRDDMPGTLLVSGAYYGMLDKTVASHLWGEWTDSPPDRAIYNIADFFAEPPVEAVVCKRELTEEELLQADYHSRVFSESMNQTEPYKSGLENGYAQGWIDHAATTLSPAELQQQAELVKRMREDIGKLRNALEREKNNYSEGCYNHRRISDLLNKTVHYQQPQ